MEELTIGLIRDIFVGEDATQRLSQTLQQVKDRGCQLAVLPEIACNPWSPATKRMLDHDAEVIGGPRTTMQANAAKEVGVGLIGAAILEGDSARFNTCLFWNEEGKLIGTYQKHHVPEEVGFWETSHYDHGVEGFKVFPFHGFNIGIQICSDMNRPQGSHILAALGADVIVGPRSTERATYEKWRPVWIANALTTSCYVASVNRPHEEQGVLIGGNSIAVDPNGKVITEADDAITTFTIRRSTIEKARVDYPGYLPCRAALYADAWSNLKD